MAIQQVNVGAAPNDKTGDKLRDAFIKLNANDDDLDSRVSTAQGEAESASTAAAGALAVGEAAQNDATQALQNASNAQTTANDAQTVANAAVPKVELADTTNPAKGAAMVGYNAYQTVRDHLNDVVTFEQFGAGKGDDDAALTRLITYLNNRSVGCVVRFDGQYIFTQPCPVKLTRSGVLLGGRGTLDLSGMPLTNDTYLIQAEGPGFTGAQTTLTSDWNTTYVYDTNGRGVQINVVSTEGFSAGDYVTVTSEEYYGGAAMSGFRSVGKGRIRRIRAVVDSTHLALDEGPNDSFDAATYTVHVRGLRLLEGLAIHDLTVIGPYPSIGFEATDVAGPALLHGLYVQGYLESGLQARNFQTSVTQIEMSDSVTIRDNIYKGAWGGCRVFSVRRPSFLNIDYECGRRPQDWDSTYRPFAGVTTREEVQTEHVQVIGGFTRNAVSGIGGHIAHFVTAMGVTVRDVNVGYHNRGKHNTIVGCDIVARTSAVTLGLGSSAMEDISSYADLYPVDSGNTYIDSTTKLRSESRGVYVTASWQSFQCDAYIEARNALMAFGKSLSNARITANFKGTDPDATYGGYCIGLGATLPSDANNIRIQGGNISNTNRAVWHKGAQSTVSNFRVDGVHFDNVNTYYVRADVAGFDAASCSVTNCTHTGTLATSPVGGTSSNPVRSLLWEANNSWGRNTDRSLVASGIVTVMSPADYVLLQVAPATTDTVTGLAGKGIGQVASLRNAGPGALNITHSNNLRLNGATSLSAVPAGSIITFVCINSTGTQWAEISRQIAP